MTWSCAQSLTCLGIFRNHGPLEKLWRRGQLSWRLHGKVKRKCRTCAQGRLDGDASAMGPRNAADCGKSEPGSSGSGGEERIKDAQQICFTDAAAIVRDFDYSFVFEICVRIVLSNANLNLTIPVCRLDGVDNQIEHGVFNLRSVNGNYNWIRRRLEFDLD